MSAEVILSVSVVLAVLACVVAVHQGRRVQAVEQLIEDSRRDQKLMLEITMILAQHWGDPPEQIKPLLLAAIHTAPIPKDRQVDLSESFMGLGFTTPLVVVIQWCRHWLGIERRTTDRRLEVDRRSGARS